MSPKGVRNVARSSGGVVLVAALVVAALYVGKSAIDGGSSGTCGTGPSDTRFIDLGDHDGYSDGKRVTVHLCALKDLKSSSAESGPSNSGWYISGADGYAIVNSKVAVKFYKLVADIERDGVSISADSSFRTMDHQRSICRQNGPCNACYFHGRNCLHAFKMVAKPGTSNHQLGDAVDFVGVQHGNDRWDALVKYAGRYGLKNYPPEPWHWSPTGN